MKVIKLLFCCLLLALPLSVKAQSGGEASAPDSVKKFVQNFYDWYVPKAVSSRSAPAWSKAVKEKEKCFSPYLGRMLRDDSEAQANAKWEIVGLDFDPFLNSQDSGKRYSVGKLVPKKEVYLVEVHQVVSRKPEEVTVTAEVAGKNGRWYFVNFLYPNNHNLLDVLKALKGDRDRPAQ